jgi:hypothetical protein
VQCDDVGLGVDLVGADAVLGGKRQPADLAISSKDDALPMPLCSGDRRHADPTHPDDAERLMPDSVHLGVPERSVAIRPGGWRVEENEAAPDGLTRPTTNSSTESVERGVLTTTMPERLARPR